MQIQILLSEFYFLWFFFHLFFSLVLSNLHADGENPRINLYDFILNRNENENIGFGNTTMNAYCMTFLVKQGVCEYFRNNDPLTQYDITYVIPNINPESHRTQAAGCLSMTTVSGNIIWDMWAYILMLLVCALFSIVSY